MRALARRCAHRDLSLSKLNLTLLWIVAQLKVNLRPLWSPAAGALGLMAERFGDEVWRLVFQELQALYSAEPPSDTNDVEPQDVNMEETGEGDADNDPWEEERTWRDPSAHKLRGAVTTWLGTQREMQALTKVSSFSPVD